MKAKSLNIKKIALTNPGVDLRQLGEVATLLREVSAGGVTPTAYDLSSPYETQIRATDLTSLLISARK
ncbi:MAG: hypothetical protein ABL961_17420 [Vicinamibacterales bacterium]